MEFMQIPESIIQSGSVQALRVYAVLLSDSDGPEDVVKLGRKELSKRCCMSVPTVMLAAKLLEDLGVVVYKFDRKLDVRGTYRLPHWAEPIFIQHKSDSQDNPKEKERTKEKEKIYKEVKTSVVTDKSKKDSIDDDDAVKDEVPNSSELADVASVVIVTWWNTWIDKYNAEKGTAFATIRRPLSVTRLAHVKARVQEVGSWELLTQSVEIAMNAFDEFALSSTWFDFDWFMSSPNNYRKLTSGNYRKAQQRVRPPKKDGWAL